MAFDPYLIWLDISPHERPVNYYRLLGVRPLESDPHIIAAAAQRVIHHVSQFQNSPQAAACQQLLGELNAARNCLLDPMRKRAYDAGFTSPGGSERTLSGPPTPGAPAATPAWLAGTVAGATPRPGERQISTTPPVPGRAAPISPQTAAPRVGIPASVAQVGSFDAPLPQLTQPQTAIPQSMASPSYIPPTNVAMGHAPYAAPSSPAPITNPNYAPLPSAAPIYPQPQQPPAWAAPQRTGQVGTVAVGEAAASDEIVQPPPRRIFRRQRNSTAIYLIFALTIAMVVFFFGAVFLLALFFTAE